VIPQSGATPDAVSSPWLDHLPNSWKPYARLARLDRPIGWWLLLLPCWWSEAMAARLAGHGPSLATLALFLLGAIVMRGAGSTWNDLADRDLDAKVERTKSRPLPSRAISPRQAFVFLIAQALIGLVILLSFNRFTVLLGLASLIPVLFYPFMKRITQHPQIVLGVAFAWGALMGFAAHSGAVPLAGLLLFAGTIFWVIGYDTIYALQDIEDDSLVGIGSTARFYGARVRLFTGLIYALSICCIAAALSFAQASIFSWLGLLGFALHLGWQILRLDRHDSATALWLFRANRDAGLILFFGVMLDANLTL
jgi:4-hydroxybenzoate polyprenyltransferase